MFYNNKIIKNPGVVEKSIKSFGSYHPGFPLLISPENKQLRAFILRMRKINLAILEKGCDSKGRAQDSAGTVPGTGAGSAGDAAAADAAAADASVVAMNANFSIKDEKFDPASMNGVTNLNSLLGGAGANGTGAAGAGGAGGVAGGPAAAGILGSGGSGSGSGSGGGSGGVNLWDPSNQVGTGGDSNSNSGNQSTGGIIADVIAPSTGGTIDTGNNTSNNTNPSTSTCPASNPNCKDANNPNANCPPGSTDCAAQLPTTPGNSECVVNAINNCLPEVFNASLVNNNTNIKGFSPQTGFVYNIPNPGGEVHRKVVELSNGSKYHLDMSVPCNASDYACQKAYRNWSNYSFNRQLLLNAPLDMFWNNPDQLWVYPEDQAWKQYYPKFTEQFLNYFVSDNKGQQLPYGPMNN